MFIPQGDWIVVTRNVRDSTSKGRIVRAGLKESTAREIARSYADHPVCQHLNAWAMHKTSY